MEVKLAQQLVILEQSPFFRICLGLKKAYNAMDRDRCLKILQDVGVGEKTIHLISRFWKEGILVCRAVGFYGEVFKAPMGRDTGGTTIPNHL